MSSAHIATLKRRLPIAQFAAPVAEVDFSGFVVLIIIVEEQLVVHYVVGLADMLAGIANSKRHQLHQNFDFGIRFIALELDLVVA